MLRAQSRYEEATIEYETAIAFDRNFANAYACLGRCKLLTGSMDEVIPLEEQAIRLSPRDRNLAAWYWQIGAVHLLQSRIDEAIRWLEKARSAYAGVPSYPRLPRRRLCPQRRDGTRLARARRSPEAQRSLFEHRPPEGGARKADVEAPKLRALVETTYFAGLRKAGMPEE